jgi:hypothetical protein
MRHITSEDGLAFRIRSIPIALATVWLGLAGCGARGSGSALEPKPDAALAAADIPAPAQQAGYLIRTYGPNPTLVTSTTTTPNTAGLFDWGFISQDVGGSASVNSDGSISIVGGGAEGCVCNSQLASATSGGIAGTFKGIAFGGGGYFEAVLKFDGWQHQSVNPKSQAGGWPAFWGMAIEHLDLSLSDQVPGQAAGFENFIEMDFMEYNIENGERNDEVYSGSLINWYGLWKKTCPDSYCTVQNSYASKIRQLNSGVNFSDYHAYGALWVPATGTSNGYIQWYFDRAPSGQRVMWAKLTNLSTMPPSRFGIGDLQHLAIMLGTGTQYPMTVSSVSVWQHSSANNLIH